MENKALREAREQREALVGKRVTVKFSGKIVAPNEWEMGGWLMFEPDDDCFPAQIGVSPSNIEVVYDNTLESVGNLELGQAIVRETQQRDQKEETGLPVGETEQYLERLTAEFHRRKDAGLWDVEEMSPE